MIYTTFSWGFVQAVNNGENGISADKKRYQPGSSGDTLKHYIKAISLNRHCS